MWTNQNPHTLLMRIKNGAETLENSLAGPQRIKQRITTVILFSFFRITQEFHS